MSDGESHSVCKRMWKITSGVYSTQKNVNISKTKKDIKVKCDHRSKFSNLSNWKVEA